MTTITVPINYRGGPLCGLTAAVQLDADGQPPVLASGRYAHAVDCPCQDGTHCYEWRPEHTGPRPRRDKPCCKPAGRGCPCYVPKTSAP